MKTIISTLVIAITLATAEVMAQSNHRAEIQVALSPYLSASDRSRVMETLLMFVLQAPAGTKVGFHDGYNLRSITELTIPELRRDTPASRQAMLKNPLAQLLAWSLQQSNTIPPAAELKDSDALRAPEWLSTMSRQPESPQRSVIMVGSLLCLSVGESDFSMANGAYPSDGHLHATLQESPYGLGGRTNGLTNTVVRWFHPNEQWASNPLHAQQVKRFWGLFIGIRGGTLAECSSDLSSVLASSTNSPAIPPTSVHPDSSDTELIMRRAVPRSVRREAPPPPPPTVKTNTARQHIDMRAKVVRASRSADGTAIEIAVAVENAHGQAIRTLAPDAFQVRVNGETPAQVEVTQIQETPDRMNVVAALDRSGSMFGAPLQAAVQAARELVLSLPGVGKQTFVKIIAFGSEVQTLCDWTDQVTLAAVGLKTLSAEGGTALLEAVEASFDALKNREGERQLVIFSDGMNSKYWPGDLEYLIRALKAAHISILAIGLRTADLDAATLGRLAKETGGRYLEAASVKEIGASFKASRAELGEPLYRLLITPKASQAQGDMSLEVSIGGTNGVVLRKLITPDAAKEQASKH